MSHWKEVGPGPPAGDRAAVDTRIRGNTGTGCTRESVGAARGGRIETGTRKVAVSEKRRILLIDDSEITLAMEKAVLEARGYEVIATSTLMEFEKTLQTWRPDLILTDIHMPEAKGTDICRTLKNEYGTQDIPIVLFSSLPDDELSKLAEQVGADGSLSKVNGLEAMGEKIDELVQSILW
nr:response regulator [Comamonas sp. JC664]